MKLPVRPIKELERQGVFIMVYAAPGVGKAQPLDSKVHIPCGKISISELKLGNRICTPFEDQSIVTGIFPQGKLPVYKISFSDGSTTKCSESHLWSVKSRYQRDFKTTPLIKFKDELYLTDGHKNYKIPITHPVVKDAKELPISPYLMGYILGDGTLREYTPFVFIDARDEDTIEEILAEVPEDIVPQIVPDKRGANLISLRLSSPYASGNSIIKTLKESKLHGLHTYDKFIPNNYLHSSINDRVNLLQGLMDSDGFIYNHNSCGFGSSSYKLIQDTRELIQSLGGIARLTEGIPTYTYKGQKLSGKKSYELHINLPEYIEPFRSSRKKDNYIPNRKYLPARFIKAVEYLGEEECVCISVSSPDGLYLTDDYIVTHNTTNVGKVVLSKWGGPAYLADMESGAESIRSMEGIEIPPEGQEINSWERLTKLVDWFEDAPSSEIVHKSLILDNMSESLGLWEEQFLPSGRPMEIQHWGQYYRAVVSITRQLRNISRKKKVNILMTAWENPRENDSGQVYKHDIDFNPALARRFPGLIDIVGYMTVVSGTSPDGSGKRELSFQAHPRTAAKFRRSIAYANVMEIPEILRFGLGDAPIADLINTLQGGEKFPTKYAERLGAKPVNTNTPSKPIKENEES